MKLRLAIALVFAAALTRLLPHPDNFTPIGAMALFGAACFNRQALTLSIPFIALFVSDLILNNVIYRQYYPEFTLITSWWIYAAFGLVMLAGWLLLRRSASPARIIVASLASSLIFFLISNLGTWAETTMYPKTTGGLMMCYAAGLPFLKNTVMGDLFFSGVLFGAFSFMNRHSSLRSLSRH